MKKSILKLTLNRETVRTLVDNEMRYVIGGNPTCTATTKLISTCGSLFHADSVLNQSAK